MDRKSLLLALREQPLIKIVSREGARPAIRVRRRDIQHSEARVRDQHWRAQ